MGVLWMRVRVWARRLGITAAVAAALTGLVAGAVMGLAAGTRRTASAPDRYTEASGGDYDLVLNQFAGDPLLEDVRALPGVREAVGFTFVTAFPVLADGTLFDEPNPFAGDDQAGGARLLSGRFTDPTAPDEFTANRSLADRLGAQPGDRFPIRAFDQPQAEGNDFDRPNGATIAFEATLVGVTENPAEFDDPSMTMIFSAAFLDAHPDVGKIATLIGVRVDPSTTPDEVLEASRALPGAEGLFSTPARIVSDGTRRAIGVQAAALWIVTAIASVAGLVVIAQVARRTIGPSEAERSTLRALGAPSMSFRTEAVVEAALLTLGAAVVAAVVCLMVSAQFPLGVLGLLEPDRGMRIDWLVLGVGVVATLLATVIVGIATMSTASTAPRRSHRSPTATTTVGGGRSLSLPLSLGARLGRARALALGGAAIAGVVGSVVVGVSLLDATDTPRRWGANYEVMFGNPFVSAPRDLVSPVRDNPNIEALTAATTASLTIDGIDTPVFATEYVRGEAGPVVLSGRAPAQDDEIGLGRELARTLGAGPGATLSATADDGTVHELRIVGYVVVPDNAGAGAWMTFAGLLQLQPTATRNLLLVNIADDAPPGSAEDLSALTFSPPDNLPTPISVKALERVIPAPFTLAIVLATMLVALTAYVLVHAVRAHRHDLAVLRALGALSGQLRRAVHWHATLLCVGALLVGVPVGIIAGRSVVSLLVDSVGLVGGATVPVLLLSVGGIGALAFANLLAAWPAHRAARVRTDALLHDVDGPATAPPWRGSRP